MRVNPNHTSMMRRIAQTAAHHIKGRPREQRDKPTGLECTGRGCTHTMHTVDCAIWTHPSRREQP